MKFNKKFTISIIGCLTLVGMFIGTRAYAIIGQKPHPEIDGWKNWSSPYVNGSAVEHGGLRIGNTVWCKRGDVLGVTAWGKVQWKEDWDNIIGNSYLTLDGTDNFSKWYIYGKNPRDIENNQAGLVTDSVTDDVTSVGAEIGHTTTDQDHYWHCGNLFWLRFNNNNRTYYPRCNFIALNGNWLTDEYSVSSWPQSIETIKTDSDAPTISITPNSQISSGSPITVSLNMNDTGCGMQKYQYTISGTSGNSSSGWMYPSSHSNLDGSPFTRYTGNGDPAQIPYSVSSMNGMVILSTPGTYQIQVTSVDNLGNTSTKASGIYTITGNPTPIPTPIPTPGPSPDNPDDPDKPKPVPLTVSASVTPNPAKQGQQVTFHIHTTGKAKYLYVYPPVDITSRDTRGTIFPLTDTIPEEDYYDDNNIKYIIPLKTPQTIRKDSGRVRQAYPIKIIAKKADGETAETTVDLDISGNVLDGIKTEIIGSGYDKKN